MFEAYIIRHLKWAAPISGIDVILGGDAHNGRPVPNNGVEQYLKSAPMVKHHTPNIPRLIGLNLNLEFAQ